MRWLWALLVVACGGKSEAPEVAVEVGSAVVPDAPTGPVAPVDAAPPPPVRPEHAVWKLVDNRHAAHRYYAGDLVIDGGDAGLAKYTRFGVPVTRWKLGSAGGTRAALPDRQAILEVPLDASQAVEIDRLELRVFAKAGQRLAVRINGRPIGKDAKSSRTTLADGWQDVSLPIEPGRLAGGENQLMLETSGARDRLGVGWLRLASKGTQVVGDPRPATSFDPAGETITLARDATLVWYVTLPEGAHLVADVTEGCKVAVRATTSDDSFVGGALVGARARVDLTKLAGRVVGLAVTAQDCPKATLRSPEIRVHGPGPTEAAKPPAPKYVVLWVMDALRADKLPVFTPGARAKAPNLEELAKTSAVFRQFYVTGNESQVSHASLWTGLYPAVHGVKLDGDAMSKLSPRLDVLAAELGKAGFHTIAVTGNGFVNVEGGYARGFQEFRNLMREAKVAGVIYGKTIVDLALARLDASRDRPTFLCFGTIDSHAPWIARKPWIDQYSPGYQGPFQELASPEALGFKPSSMGCSITPPPADIERLRAIYDSTISYQDQLVGQVVAALKDRGIWDQTLFVITSDHGDELFEDTRCGHGGSLRDSLVRVPLLIHYPPRFGGAVIDEGADAVDVLPTILEALHRPVPDAVQGESLLGRPYGYGRDWARPSYASQYEYAHAMRIGRWKLVVAQQGVLYLADLVADPDELRDVTRDHPVERRMLTDNLGMFLALRTQWRKRAWGVTTNVTTAGAAALDEASF